MRETKKDSISFYIEEKRNSKHKITSERPYIADLKAIRQAVFTRNIPEVKTKMAVTM